MRIATVVVAQEQVVSLAPRIRGAKTFDEAPPDLRESSLGIDMRKEVDH